MALMCKFNHNKSCDTPEAHNPELGSKVCREIECPNLSELDCLPGDYCPNCIDFPCAKIYANWQPK